MKTAIYVLTLILMPIFFLEAQERIISGVVRDVNTHQELHSVNIFIKGTQIGTTSDYTGRFTLHFPVEVANKVVVFQHVAYDPVELPLQSLIKTKVVYLQPRIIPLQGVRIEEMGEKPPEIVKDIPQPVEILGSRQFDIRGFVDAGDLLRTDQSVQVDEELNGKKTVAIRGGNADEVVVLYNGVRLNNTYDNVFDFSLIDLEDVQRIEIIRGSNTALYGPEAFSGVVNIVPRMEQDYTVRFQQRLGTYRSGNWGVHLYRNFNRLQANYSFRQGGYKRTFEGLEESEGLLTNRSEHHTANVSYRISGDPAGGSRIGALLIHTRLDYRNHRDLEDLQEKNRLASFTYSGDLGFFKHLKLSFSLRNSDEDQTLTLQEGDFYRSFQDEAYYFNFEKRQKLGRLDWLLAYSYHSARLDFTDRRTNPKLAARGVEAAEIHRTHHGLVSILKYHGATGSDFFQSMDLDLSLRHDRIRDLELNSVNRDPSAEHQSIFGTNDWQATLAKFSMNLTGYREDLTVNGYLNVGRNAKFPTLFQQLSSPLLFTRLQNRPRLEPERNTSFELGVVTTKEVRPNPIFYGWQVSANYFQNQYDNKFRIFTSPGIPISFYDNTQNAKISGFDTKASVFLYQKKITVELGLSKYAITEKAAFPFKSDFKRTLNFIVEHAGYSFQILWFKEGEQASWLRFPNGVFAEVTLPSYSNIDLHLSKKFAIGKLKLLGNITFRNLLDDKTTLEGLAIRDRRFYVTFGVQY